MRPAYPTTALSMRATRELRLFGSDISATNRLGGTRGAEACRSIAITPRRWRRRIFVTSRLAAPGSAIPRDLSIRLPQVHRHDVEHLVVFLSEEPRHCQLDERVRVGVRGRGRGELHPGAHRSEHVP